MASRGAGTSPAGRRKGREAKPSLGGTLAGLLGRGSQRRTRTAAAEGDGPADRVKCCGQSVRPLLSRDESEVLEFKSWPASRPDAPSKPPKMEEKIAKELCGLVNARGGHLLIGVGDDGRVEGLAPGGGRLQRKERDEMLAWATNVIVDYLGVEHDGRFCRKIAEVDGLDVLCCAVEASEDGPIVLKKRLDGKHDFFVRAGSTCRPLNSKEMLEYMKTRWPGRGRRPGRGRLGGRPGDGQGRAVGERPRHAGRIGAARKAGPRADRSAARSVTRSVTDRPRAARSGSRPNTGGRHGGGRGSRYGDSTGGRPRTTRSGSRPNTSGRHGGGRTGNGGRHGGGRTGNGGRHGGGRQRSGSSPRRGRRR